MSKFHNFSVRRDTLYRCCREFTRIIHVVLKCLHSVIWPVLKFEFMNNPGLFARHSKVRIKLKSLFRLG